MVRFVYILGCLLLTSLAVYAGEIPYNSDFELGTDGFVCSRYLRPKINKDL